MYRVPFRDDYAAGSSEPWTVDVVCAMMVALRPSVVVETGTFEGRTTRDMWGALWRAHIKADIYSIEADEGRANAAKLAFMDQGYENVHIAWGDALHELSNFADASVDFVFLDDDHTAEHVAKEIMEVKRILRPGGVCVCHDVVGPFGLDTVVKLAGGICLPFVRLHKAGGLGIIVK